MSTSDPQEQTPPQLDAMAQQPKIVEVDGQRMEMHSLKDQIELDRYLASKKAAAAGRRGFRITKMRAGGAI